MSAPMKIAFIVGGFPAVSETFILNQITGLIDAGCDITIFAEFDPGDTKIQPLVKEYDLMKHVHYFNHLPRNEFKRILTAIGC